VACAPLGSFRGQVNYFGDVRVVFDVLFPGVLPGSAVEIPQSVIVGWESTYQLAVAAALEASPSRTAQLLNVTGIAVDPSDPTGSAIPSVLAALWYNIHATNDGVGVLGGNPFDNRTRWYRGSSNDLLLNIRVARHSASSTALANMSKYEATGRLRRPTQLISTNFDPVVPVWQSQIYQVEAFFRSGLRLWSSYSNNYGHCAFEVEDVLSSFATLVLRVSLNNLFAVPSVFPDAASQRAFMEMSREQGAEPVMLPRLPGTLQRR
jgi:hypothetical protein